MATPSRSTGVGLVKPARGEAAAICKRGAAAGRHPAGVWKGAVSGRASRAERGVVVFELPRAGHDSALGGSWKPSRREMVVMAVCSLSADQPWLAACAMAIRSPCEGEASLAPSSGTRTGGGGLSAASAAGVAEAKQLLRSLDIGRGVSRGVAPALIAPPVSSRPISCGFVGFVVGTASVGFVDDDPSWEEVSRLLAAAALARGDGGTEACTEAAAEPAMEAEAEVTLDGAHEAGCVGAWDAAVDAVDDAAAEVAVDAAFDAAFDATSDETLEAAELAIASAAPAEMLLPRSSTPL